MGHKWMTAHALALLAVLPWLPAASAHPARYEVLYSFGSKANDPYYFQSALTPRLGNLYGTSYGGGSPSGPYKSCGTVFKVTPQGVETVLHSFLCNVDNGPAAGLTYFNGKFYGATFEGAVHSLRHNASGSIFSIDLQGNFVTLHRFGPDGHYGDIIQGPVYNLTRVGAFFYGELFFNDTTTYTSSIFRVAYDGTKFTILHSFDTAAGGLGISSPLLNIGGTLYGTTYGGGAYGGGLVFSMSPQGAVSTLYQFKEGGGGAQPEGALATIGSTIYGVDAYGGKGGGTIYSLSTSGVEKTFHLLRPGTEVEPGLISVGGVLYGVTSEGGEFFKGTVFRVNPDGVQVVLHSFGSFPGDGISPVGGLAYMGGYLYGTTWSGGSAGTGTVYRIGLSR